MMTGSSGGFLSGWQLVETNVGEAPASAGGAPGIDVSVERAVLNVSGHEVSNCAVPCYFIACYLAGGTDPPETWKPCSWARTRVAHPSLAEGSARITTEVLDAAGSTLSRSEETTPAGLIGGEWVSWRQLRLYERPNQALAPGDYSVRVRAALPDGSVASVIVPFELR
jgi:hypothetical protein